MPTNSSSPYNRRIVDEAFDVLLRDGAVAIALEGAKGVGKTATALRRASTVYQLDDAAIRDLVAAGGAELLGRATPPVLLDEWQRYAPVWDLVRRAVDSGAEPGRFLLTGSAASGTTQTHTGAGRIVRLPMSPLSLAERGIAQPTVSLGALLTGTRPPVAGHTSLGLDTYVDEILASGFPGIRRASGRYRTALLDGYLKDLLTKGDAEPSAAVRDPAQLLQWLRAYAAATATPAAFETIRAAATGVQQQTPAKTTADRYRALLMQLWALAPVPGWLPTQNRLAVLTTAAKHHLVDPALAARVLGLSAAALLGGTDTANPPAASMLGPLFESLATQSVRVYAAAHWGTMSHCRTKGGRHEVDLIVQGEDGRIVACEVKLGAEVTDRDVRHLHWLRESVGATLADAIVLTTGRDAYRRADGIGVVPLALLGP
jgi:uncharacterized protein